MKEVYVLFVSLFVLLSCSSEGDEAPAPESNTAPSVPLPVYPLDKTLCSDALVRFEWGESTDAENDRISYRLEVSSNSSFPTTVFSQSVSSTSRQVLLPEGEVLYWRVQAVDSEGAGSGYSAVSQFITEGEGVSNHIPFAPGLVSPQQGSEIAGPDAALSWTAGDADGDALTFDVYLDTGSDPSTRVSEGQVGTTYVAGGLAAATTYYFRIVVKDDNGGVTIGQVWSFKTK